ncbi:MAG TPA: hypothetical protein VK541_01360 [Pedobacter sp.]|uniref:glycine-rich domain-containing protein n=1 Tax=Pedobacter sp. TaxID=1411316 RepID=UPI002CD5A4F0|nr:hypothetical protein [Pedobacter sp.]HMI01095.1 hypothetical protein [Pedobacter sp.]
MNTALWNSIVDFDLDHPVSEYGFSTRLEHENGWTVNFAKGAILEYKKFMYLAATSEFMVSPSEIVDVVWHQHLIFSQSYDAFCTLLGKKIAHIPSTHNKNESSKFKLAKDRTQRLYAENFGSQPAEFWEFSDIYEPLMLKKSALTVWKLLSLGVLPLIPAVFALYFLLRPLYIHIQNPYFSMGYMAILFCSLIVLRRYNRSRLTALVNGFDKSSFLFNLSALELVYLKRSELSDVVHGVVNNMVAEQKISISPEGKLAVKDFSAINGPVEFCVMETIGEEVSTEYPVLFKRLVLKPAFHKTERAMEAFKKYFSRSVYFIRLFAVNFTVLSLVLMLGLVRVATGIIRDKPVVFIIFIVIIYIVLGIRHLYKLKVLIGSTTLPEYYQENILAERPVDHDWEWNYFSMGAAVFVAAFVPLHSYAERNPDAGSGSSCSSGCSSSCGGGDGGGCGGCGGD